MQTLAADVEGPEDSTQNLKSAGMAATSGSLGSLLVEEATPSAGPIITRPEQAWIDCATALPSIKCIQKNLAKLQTNFILQSSTATPRPLMTMTRLYPFYPPS